MEYVPYVLHILCKHVVRARSGESYKAGISWSSRKYALHDQIIQTQPGIQSVPKSAWNGHEYMSTRASSAERGENAPTNPPPGSGTGNQTVSDTTTAICQPRASIRCVNPLSSVKSIPDTSTRGWRGRREAKYTVQHKDDVLE